VGYDDRGTGPALVLLHPFPFARTVWAGIADALAVHRRVIAVDARGFGEFPPAGPFAIADLADDLAALLDRLAIARATVLGMSMGGYAALAFAMRHRERLSALVLADTRAAADSAEIRAARAGALASIAGAGPAAYLAALPRRLSPGAPPASRTCSRARDARRQSARWYRGARDRPDRTAELGDRLPDAGRVRDRGSATPAAEIEQTPRDAGARFVPIAGPGTCRTSRRPDPSCTR
jgi:pimeloyl-ACP methyl ester carboxylesterase